MIDHAYQPTLPATMVAPLRIHGNQVFAPAVPNDGGPVHSMSCRQAIALEVLKTRMASMGHVPTEAMPLEPLVRLAYRAADLMLAEGS